MSDLMARRRPLLQILACFGMGIAVGLIPWLFRHRFYFHDDMQHQHMPIFVHIGRLLRAGEAPILTLASFTSGNLLAEYQFALLNPVSLALYAVLPSFSSLETAALFLACFYYGVLTAGTYVLARSYGVETAGAGLAALVIASNNLICYWFASSWFPIFVSLAWFVWAWAFLARADRSRLDWLLAVVFSYLTVTSGWPQTTIMLGILCLTIAVQAWRASGLRPAALVTAALVAATLLSATAILALLSTGEVAARYRGISNGNVLVPNLRDLLAMSSPFHRGYMSWGGYKLTGTPMFVLAWFTLPLLPLIRWREVEWRRPQFITLAIIAGLSLFATQGPEELSSVRWPFRWVPYFHIAWTVLFLALVSRAGFAPATRVRVGVVTLLFALCILSSLQADPASWRLHLAAFIACLLALAAFLAIPERQQAFRYGVLGAVSLVFFAATHAVFPQNTNVPDWGLPAEVEPGLRPNSAPRAYTLYLGWLGDAEDVDRLDEFRTGMMPRVREAATVNGYTPIGHRFGSEFLCTNIFGETCPELAPRLLLPNPFTGVPYVDLLRIDRLIVMKGPHLDNLRRVLTPDWRLEFDGSRAQRFVRALPNAALPGTVSWVSPNAAVEAQGRARSIAEQVRVSRSGNGPTTIIFARLWWPGYQAEFGGESLPVRAHLGIFVKVNLPAGAGEGILTLRFRPPQPALGIAGAVGGLATILAVLAFPGFGRFGAPRSSAGSLQPRRLAIP